MGETYVLHLEINDALECVVLMWTKQPIDTPM